MQQKNNQDKWELALEKKLIELKNCQKTNTIDSCMKCKKIIGCILRNEYIKTVYESMNKGSGGGFEF